MYLISEVRMSSTPVFKQDLPPQGGYAPINFKRIPAKTVLNAPMIYGGFFISLGIGYWTYKRGMKQLVAEKIEMKSADLALTPLMLAERDREFLKQCRKNRDAEAKLMKDVEGWEVGTWYGHPIYKTTGDKWFDPEVNEFYAHTSNPEKRKFGNHVNWLKMD
ncbi:NADH dehydrogenase [ubiquinone] 1 alpha subcomplex subunit 13 [Eurytemora carolleeae]|uniref:NADH dehydrogenase [ubiquinone] 1 alpha subcomplex subunit 13 n=1 Tax=Eurytemora carolleeae TaxID=1294199 RepID=UPI000C789C1E|nr:NADH dehydrogenase [ubiquinone] 1 alpha subcomplex subunit 13 [Eurytemora carolleeae]|eukprot:XP_023320719.1 NADH dehydrogenase [ubiquinone] 1 alpha subcomplex subunit 13-like [Eurytemora affinis]